MKNYIVQPRLYKTGYISHDNQLRLKQGLMTQEIANLCRQSQSSPLPKGDKCSFCNMRPFPVTHLTYK